MSAKQSHKLKQLQSQKDRLEVELEQQVEERKNTVSKFDTTKNKLNKIKAEMESLGSKEPIISEHSIIRYLERVLKVNVEDIKYEMLSERSKKAIMTLGSGKYPIGNGFKLIVKGHVVVSVVGPR